MAWKEVIELNQLQQKERYVSMIDGHKILLIWHEDNVHAIQAKCPHLNLSLAKGKITEEKTIICPFHKSEFNLTSGENTCWSPWPPVVGPLLGKISPSKPLKIYPTRVDNGMISVELN